MAHHRHDCTRCTFLGTHHGFDMYMHRQKPEHMTDVLVRFGSEGDEYYSGTLNSHASRPSMIMAQKVAKERIRLEDEIAARRDQCASGIITKAELGCYVRELRTQIAEL